LPDAIVDQLRVVIVDDEPLVRDGLRAMLADTPGMDVVGEACDGVEAVDLIDRARPDIVFLDVQMPERDGFSVLEALGDVELPAVVFVTAYDQYAVRAFDVHAADYLLKPFGEDRFRVAIDRVRARLAEGASAHPADRRSSSADVRALLTELRRKDGFAERLLVKDEGKVLVVQVDDIYWIEAADNYVKLHTARRTYLMREPIKSLEQRLDPRRFLRAHRSVIVNVSRISELVPQASGNLSIVLVSGARVPLGRRYRAGFMAAFGGDAAP
jgi:two-component system LytT family response regulator